MASRTPRAPSLLDAYVLHRYDWSESSLVLDLFTREQGRIAVAAKGAKRPHSQLRSVLLPFQRIHVGLARGGGDAAAAEVQTLRSAEWAGGPPMPGGSALFAGFYLNELLLKLLARHDPHAALFDAYAATVAALAAPDEAEREAALRAFELTLLRETGVLPELGVVTQTQQPLEPARGYRLQPDAGVAPAAGGEPALAGALLLQLQAALDHGGSAALQQACRGALAELKGALRVLLHYHLGAAVPLRTRQVMLDLQRLHDPAPR